MNTRKEKIECCCADSAMYKLFYVDNNFKTLCKSQTFGEMQVFYC